MKPKNENNSINKTSLCISKTIKSIIKILMNEPRSVVVFISLVCLWSLDDTGVCLVEIDWSLSSFSFFFEHQRGMLTIYCICNT